MKRFLPILLLLVLIATAAFAELPDFSAMSFEELQTMKTALDAEFNSRPESSGIKLGTGSVVIGEDIKPGNYYIAMTQPSRLSQAHYRIYTDKETFEKEDYLSAENALDSGYLFLGEIPISILLEEGNVFVIDEGNVTLKASQFSDEELYKYEPPQGTYAEIGIYKVGTDIPTGKYLLYPATVKSGEYRLTKTVVNDDGTTEEKYVDSNMVNVSDPLKPISIELKEDYILEIKSPIIITKQTPLSFE